MGDSVFGEAAFLSGQEIVNNARTLAYLQAGFGPLNLQISGGCSCPNIQALIECSADPYLSPALDPAPWYDASVPESGDFGGFLAVEVEGLGSTYTRNVTEKVTGGAVLGRLRPGPRTIVWKGFLFGRSDCAVRYGLSWMTANLVGTNCDCNGEELDILVCCPELTLSTEVDLLTEGEDPFLTESDLNLLLEAAAGPEVSEGLCGLPPIKRPTVCPPFTQPDAFRQLKNVALMDGPKILSQRRIGCKASCGSDSCAGDTIIMEIEFSLMAGNPFMYGCPVCLCVDQTFPVFLAEDCPNVWYKVADSNAVTNPLLCGSPVCPELDDCTDFDSQCGRVELPPLVPFTDGCFCDPIEPVQFCCSVPADSYGQFFDGAPIIEISSGSAIMRATTIRFFENLTGGDCCDTAEDPCLNCDSLQIRYIPENSVLTIDGTTRTVTVSCDGGPPIRAEHLTVTPFSWPILQCIDFCICIETEGGIVAEDAMVTVSVVPREI